MVSFSNNIDCVRPATGSISTHSVKDDLLPILVSTMSGTAAAGAVLFRSADGEDIRVVKARTTLSVEEMHGVMTAVYEHEANGEREGLTWVTTAADELLMITTVDLSPAGYSFVLVLHFGRLDSQQRDAVVAASGRVVPLARSYLRFWQRAQSKHGREHALGAALHAIKIGVVILGEDAKIRFTNRAADEILSRGDGLRRSGHSLKPSRLADGITLHAALTHITRDDDEERGGFAPLLTFRRSDSPPLVGTLVLLKALSSAPEDWIAAIYLVDPKTDLARGVPALCRLYGLSPVETTLVCHLMKGEVLVEAARKMRIKELTARSYLKQIFAKTGTNRQTDLVINLLSCLAPVDDNLGQQPESTHATIGW